MLSKLCLHRNIVRSNVANMNDRSLLESFTHSKQIVFHSWMIIFVYIWKRVNVQSEFRYLIASGLKKFLIKLGHQVQFNYALSTPQSSVCLVSISDCVCVLKLKFFLKNLFSSWYLLIKPRQSKVGKMNVWTRTNYESQIRPQLCRGIHQLRPKQVRVEHKVQVALVICCTLFVRDLRLKFCIAFSTSIS